MPSCLIIVENLPVPADRRVWQEALALSQAGWDVSIICPATDQHPDREVILDGINIYRHPLPLEGRSPFGFLVEYLAALFFELMLSFRVWRRHGFDVVHICNPPDLLFLVAAPFKLIGKKVIFDHHDPWPELFVSKFNRRGALHAAVRFCERLTFRLADVVISANETMRKLAIERGGKAPADVFTVHSIPDQSRFFRLDVPPEQKGKLIIGYVGVLNKQDGVDHLLHAVADLKYRHALSDFYCRIVGDGPELPTLRKLAEELSISDVVEFAGFLVGNQFLAALSSFDIGVIPDPYDEYNDKISMNKVFEYSAVGIPIVSYNLTETRRLLGDAGTYAEHHSPASLAAAIQPLATDEVLRRKRAEAALERAKEMFHWSKESEKLVAAYARALASSKTIVTQSAGGH